MLQNTSGTTNGGKRDRMSTKRSQVLVLEKTANEDVGKSGLHAVSKTKQYEDCDCECDRSEKSLKKTDAAREEEGTDRAVTG